MSWRIAYASRTGTSHIASGRDCEDSNWCAVETLPDGAEALIMFVCDGAGSAARAARGAEVAIDAARQCLTAPGPTSRGPFDEAWARTCLRQVREALRALAEAEGRVLRDFACTFLGLVSTEAETLAFQIGDGGMVVDVGAGLVVPIVPMVGEYANQTRFVTDGDALDRFEARQFGDPVLRAAAFTDGVQTLALNMAAGTAHAPFFDAFFPVLERAQPDQELDLCKALGAFLDSEAVNARTDDDKTLVLAARTLSYPAPT